jgi:hypothetical protein
MKNGQIRRYLTIVVIVIIAISMSLHIWRMVVEDRNKEIMQPEEVPNYKSPDVNVPPVTPLDTAEEQDSKKTEKLVRKKDENISVANDELDFLTEELFNEPLGTIIAQKRTDKIIADLKKESLENSLANLDNVDFFYYPGFYSQAFRAKPVDRVHTILSNRRFIKLYDELKAKNHNEQYIYLSRSLKDKLSQYHNLLSRYNSPNLYSEDYLELARVSDIPGKPQTLSGTRLAIQSIALLSGVLGNVQMWPELREVFQNPIVGKKMSLDKYETVVRQSINKHPVFPVGIQAQTIWLLSQYSGEEKNIRYGFNSSKIKSSVSDDMLTTINVPNYQSRITMYDLVHTSGGKPIDMSYGSHPFKFLVLDDVDLLTQLVNEYNTTEN